MAVGQANTTALATKMAASGGTKKAVTIHDQKMSMVPQFQMLLNGDQEKAERAFRIAVTEYNKNAGLQACDKASFWGSVINAVQMNLEPGPLGHAYLIPYKGTCTLQIGFKGLLELIYRSGRVDTVYAYPVYKTDKFKFSLGAHPDIIHEQDMDAEPTDNNIVCFYAVAHVKGSAIPRIEVMTRKQVDAIKARAQAKSGPWITDYAEMGRKTVLKRLSKTLPLSVESQTAISKDETVRKSLSTNGGMEFDDSTSVYELMAADMSSKLEDKKKEIVDVSTGEINEGVTGGEALFN